MTIITLHYLCFNYCVKSLRVALVSRHFQYLRLEQWPWILHNDLQRDGAQFLLSKYLCIKEFWLILFQSIIYLNNFCWNVLKQSFFLFIHHPPPSIKIFQILILYKSTIRWSCSLFLLHRNFKHITKIHDFIELYNKRWFSLKSSGHGFMMFAPLVCNGCWIIWLAHWGHHIPCLLWWSEKKQTNKQSKITSSVTSTVDVKQQYFS